MTQMHFVYLFYLFIFVITVKVIFPIFTKELAIGTYNFFIPVVHSRHNLFYFIYMYTIFLVPDEVY